MGRDGGGGGGDSGDSGATRLGGAVEEMRKTERAGGSDERKGEQACG